MRLRSMIILTAAAVAALLPIVSAQVGNSRKEAADWPMYNRDLNGTRYSPLTQINTRNVARLTRAWTYKIGKDYTSGITGGSEMTPIVVNGVMYLANAKKVLALEPETGKEIWNYELKNGNPTKRCRLLARRWNHSAADFLHVGPQADRLERLHR